MKKAANRQSQLVWLKIPILFLILGMVGAFLLTTGPMGIFAASNDGDGVFSYLVLPDTQQECYEFGNTHTSVKDAIAQGKISLYRHRFLWLTGQNGAPNNKLNDWDTRFVLQVGDVVNNTMDAYWTYHATNPGPYIEIPDDPQYLLASNAWQVLDNYGMPYILALGNHDTMAVGNGSGSARNGRFTRYYVRKTDPFNYHFSLNRYNSINPDITYYPFEENKVDNMYFTVEAEGKKWLMMNLELYPRNEVLTWADEVIKAHSDYNVILVTHSFGSISSTGKEYGDNSPKDIWDKVIKINKNVKFLHSGHSGSISDAQNNNNAGLKFINTISCLHAGLTDNVVLKLEVNVNTGTVVRSVYSPKKPPYSEGAYGNYNKTFTGMVFESPANGLGIGADKGTLYDVIKNTRFYKQNLFTASSWSELQSALTTANSVYNNASATPSQISDAINAVKTAVANLESYSKPLLAELIAKCQKLSSSNYSSSSWEALDEALSEAVAVNNDAAATETAIVAAIDNLQAAYDNLVFTGSLMGKHWEFTRGAADANGWTAHDCPAIGFNTTADPGSISISGKGGSGDDRAPRIRIYDPPLNLDPEYSILVLSAKVSNPSVSADTYMEIYAAREGQQGTQNPTGQFNTFGISGYECLHTPIKMNDAKNSPKYVEYRWDMSRLHGWEFELPPGSDAKLMNMHIRLGSINSSSSSGNQYSTVNIDYIRFYRKGNYNVIYNPGAEGVTNMPRNFYGIDSGSGFALSGIVPVRSGYTFLGWSKTPGGPVIPRDADGVQNIDITGDTEVYAVWASSTAENFTATFSAGGAAGTPPAPITQPEGTSIEIPGPGTLVNGNKEFIGWKAGDTVYTPGQSYTLVGDVTFEPVWEEDTQEPPWEHGDYDWAIDGEYVSAGNLELTVITRLETVPEYPMAIVALYAENGSLIKVMLVDVEADKTVYPVTYSTEKNVASIKAFLIDKFQNLKPLAQFCDIPVE